MTTFRCSLWTHTDGECCPAGTICPNCPGEIVDEPADCQAATAARRLSGAPAQSSAARRGTDVSEKEKAFWLSPTLALLRTPSSQPATAARRSSGGAPSGAQGEVRYAREDKTTAEGRKGDRPSRTFARPVRRPAPQARFGREDRMEGNAKVAARPMTRFMIALLMGGLLIALFGSIALMTTRVAEIEQHLAWEARV